MNTPLPPAPDFEAIKTRQRGVWASGDYSTIGTRLTIVGELLCEAADLRAGERVLDVATGNGITALAAARRWAQVVGIDFVPALIERARERAAADRLDVEFRVADAEALPFDDASFDLVTSTVGVMFAPNQPRAAAELLRVCRPGGRIALASWTPEGFLGQLFRVFGGYAPPPAGLNSPMRWGSEQGLAELLGDEVTQLQSQRCHYRMCYRDAAHWLDTFRGVYGPVLKLFEGLDERRREALAADIARLLAQHDRGGGRGLVIQAEYLQAVATRR